MPTITYRGSAADVRDALRRVPGLAVSSGRLAGTLGNALLGKVHAAFVAKSKGGTGDDGVRWPAKKAGGPILIESAELLRSFTPGTGDAPSGAPGQVFDMAGGMVRVGTSLKGYHHRGVPGRLPARPFWPAAMPPAWSAALARAAREGVARIILESLGGRP